MKHCGSFLLVPVAVFTLSACAGGGAPRKCGDAKDGEKCVEKADCGCGLQCLDSVCAVVFTATQPADNTPALTGSASSRVKEICDKQKTLAACTEKEFDPNECLAKGATAEVEAKKVGCGSHATSLFDCLLQNFPDCPETPDEGSSELDEAFLEKCQIPFVSMAECLEAKCAIKKTVCSGGESGCEVRFHNGCQGSTADCEPVEGATETRFSCTCGESKSPEKSFQVYAEDCCDVTDTVAEACGLVNMPDDDAVVGGDPTLPSADKESSQEPSGSSDGSDAE